MVSCMGSAAPGQHPAYVHAIPATLHHPQVRELSSASHFSSPTLFLPRLIFFISSQFTCSHVARIKMASQAPQTSQAQQPAQENPITNDFDGEDLDVVSTQHTYAGIQGHPLIPCRRTIVRIPILPMAQASLRKCIKHRFFCTDTDQSLERPQPSPATIEATSRMDVPIRM